MTTPTKYPLEYDDDFCASGPCGTGDCLGKILFNTRPQNFCEDVILRKDCTVYGSFTVVNDTISVGGITFTPRRVTTLSGTYTLLVAINDND